MALTRRTVLLGAAATTSPVVLGAVGSTAVAAPLLPLVKPVWSERVRRSYGVGVHPNYANGVYRHIQEWTGHAAELNTHHIRGKYTPGLLKTAETVARCRALGLRWSMAVLPEDWSMSLTELRAALAHIRDHAADVCLAIEGINEPNHNRDGSPVRADWAAAAVDYQRVIREFIDATPSMSYVKSVGPTIQDGADDPSPDFRALGAAGIAPYLDYAGLHSYPSGWQPDSELDIRLGWVREAWGQVPTWVTETGYNTARNAVMDGPKPVPPDVAATYGARSVLAFFRRGCRAARYQLLDSPNPANDEPQDNYGLVECTGTDPATWSYKAEFGTMRSFLGSLKDGAAAYSPPAVRLQVSAPPAVRWQLVGRSDGTTTLLAYRDLPVWNPDFRIRVSVTSVNVTVTDRLGSRVVAVGPRVVAIPIR